VSAPAFAHRPVLVDLVVELFAPVPPGVVVDATVGGGGHAAALLDAHPHLSVLGLDQDPEAVTAASERLGRFGTRALVRQARFDQLARALADVTGLPEHGSPSSRDGAPAGSAEAAAATPADRPAKASGVLFDLGVSSPQLDRPQRGFSYRADGPLDMRMDPTSPRRADDIVNHAEVGELTRILRTLGDERYASRVGRAIVAARPVQGTAQLAEVVREAIPAPARRRGGHPARRTFQALRIAVNDELAILPGTLDQALEVLVPGGRCVAVAYHSGEDRIVKARFRHAATGGWTGPADLPPPAEVRPTVRLLRRGAWKPSAAEIAANPRAEAARARAVEKLPLQEVA
jgi:16S rRNA (cytosine1402-N4)-methyltransferase